MVYQSFLSPIHEYSNLPFRLLCQQYGADAACVPMVSATTIARRPDKVSLVDTHAVEKNVGVQLVGNEPGDFGKAAKIIEKRFPFITWLNINCGCPSAQTIECGGGSALLDCPEVMVRILEDMKKSTELPVTVKIRVKDGFEGTNKICEKLEKAGADFIVVHARTAAQGYSGKADWRIIKKLNEAVDVPLVGNGDIKTASQGNDLVKEGYCDFFMVGRAAMENPMLFSDKKPVSMKCRKGLLEEYLALYRKYIGEPDKNDLKLKAVNFISGVQDAASIRDSICRAKTVEGVMGVIERSVDYEA